MADPFDFQVLWVLQPGHLPANRARYQIFNGKKELLASAADTERRARFEVIPKTVPDGATLVILGADGDHIMTMIRQHVEYMTELRDAAGELVGKIRTGSTRRTYTLLDEEDEVVAKVTGDLSLKNFAVADSSGGKLAQVRKTNAGLFKEMFTKNDHYKVEFIGPVPPAARTLIAMVPVVLDLTLYEPL
jgi:uncharacterized protein YxjI